MIRPMTPPTASLPKQRSAFGKVRLLLWKNFLLQKRHKFHTIIDVFLPVCFFLFCAWLQSKVEDNTGLPKKYAPLEIDSLASSYSIFDLHRENSYPPIEKKLVFTPNNPLFTKLMKDVRDKLKLDDVVGVADSAQLEDTLVKDALIAGIEFHHPNSTDSTPNAFSYSIRFPGELRTTYTSFAITYNWKTNQLFEADAFETRYLDEDDGGPPSYYKEGFLAIQNAIATSLMNQSCPSSVVGNTIPEIFVQRFPQPGENVNELVKNIQFLMALIFLLSLNYTFMNSVRFISIEKENQLKEAMKIMGLDSWMHYLSWFIRTLTMLSISMIFITILLTKPWFGATQAIFPNSSSLCLFTFLIGYCICLITFGFVSCAFFTKSKSAMTGSTILWYATSVPYFLVYDKYDAMPGWLRILFCFSPNAAVSFGFKLIIRMEEMGLGLTWRSAFQTASVYDNLTVATIFGFFILNAILLFFITLYVENVLPGGYGVAKPWYYIFTKEFWQQFGSYQKFEDQNSGCEQHEFTHSTSSNSEGSNFESEPMNKPIGIEIRNLSKSFTKDKMAVNKLSLNIYDNQITCLLGQNGAGKTTTISMLTGMMEPTSGTALINGYDIRTKMDSARCSMGFCPQHNILFDELTVREHILFYCCLKGLSNEAAENEVRRYTQLLELQGKIDVVSSALSGGMKRKLSVVIALCGHSKVVFLDEPTSGMDPGARRALWDILLAEKKDRTILLTTHFMDEADVLSDRIAILADGDLKCAGSTFFLKKRFGTGYHLICAKDDQCYSKAVTQLLQKHIPDIRIENETDSEVSYLLTEDKIEQFTIIFEDLEMNLNRLNLKSFGISLTTLEEIFLNIGVSEKVGHVSANSANPSLDEESAISETRVTLNGDHVLLKGPALLWNQFIAMFKKRSLCWWRSILSFIYHNLFAFFMLGLVIFQFGSLFKGMKGLPPLDITVDSYKSLVTILQNGSDSKIATNYRLNIEKSSATLETVGPGNMQTNLLNLAQTSLKKYKFQYLTAISFNTSDTIIAWFNNQALHSASLALDLVHNAMIKTFCGDDHSIHVTNAPLKFQPKNDTTPDPFENIDGFGYLFASATAIVMAILSASYIAYYIKENECNARFLQYASGVNVPIFWAASILWDLFTNSITILVIIIMLAIGQHEGWKSPGDLAVVFLLLFLYNFAMIPVICIFSLMFSKPTTGTNVVTIVSIILAIIFLVDKFTKMLHTVARALLWAYPLCTLIEGLLKMPELHTAELMCQNICEQGGPCDCYFGHILAWNDPGLGKNLALMFGTGMIVFIILLAIEFGAVKFIKMLIFHFMPKTYPYTDPASIDDDVLTEKERIDQMSLNQLKSETMVMQNVSKFYGNFCAVNKFSVSIKRGECFGLLGKNGAGKSSIFKMLTGETIISSGEVFTQGYNQKYQLHQIHKFIGYCPQFDALLTGLTCRETLEIFAMLRGIPSHDVKFYIENTAQSLDFIQHIDKKVKQLSGGNKRKLSASLAIIGNLNVIFLDEPTTGMDPATKRNLWNVVIQSREAGKSIILTSHSMEECEALCTRMTVLVNGKCKCLGSSQHLKNKFCKGFELKIKVKTDDSMNLIDVKNFVMQTFNGAIFREEYQGILTYSIPADNIKWSTLFGLMENAKKTLKIDDYSISQNALEQVVLTLVKDQQTRQNFEVAN